MRERETNKQTDRAREREREIYKMPFLLDKKRERERDKETGR